MTDVLDSLRDAVAAAEGGDGGPPQVGPHDDPIERLPSDCPVVPLGRAGSNYFYLDSTRQVISLPASKHGRLDLVSLFAPNSGYLKQYWPRWSKVKTEDLAGKTIEDWRVTGWKPEEVANRLMDECAQHGFWKLATHVRGRGAWRDADDQIIVHCGKELWTINGALEPGQHGAFVYPADEEGLRPSAETVAACDPDNPHDGPVAELLGTLRTWNWQRPEVDPMLMLGWIGAAMMSGALDWRPMVFLTGDMATGKSELQKLVGQLFAGSIIQTADTTAAGIYQHVGQSCLPIAIDELEARADNTRADAVMNLMRLASSGSVMLRGGQDHTPVDFQARSCFLFSAILIPPLEPQDRSRMAILRLQPLARDAKKLSLNAKRNKDTGRKILRRMIDQFPRFDATFAAYHAQMTSTGHAGRAADQFAALLASADLLIANDVPDSDSLHIWADRLAPDKLRESIDIKSNAEACLDWLIEAQPDNWRGGSKQTVADLCREYRKTKGGDGIVLSALATGGMTIVRPRRRRPGDAPFELVLAVGDSHRGVMEIFKGSKWSGTPGSNGGWVEALRRLPGTEAGKQVRIGGAKPTRATFVPLSMILGGSTEADIEANEEIEERAI